MTTLQYTYNINNLTRDKTTGRIIEVKFTITTTDGVDTNTTFHQTALPAPKDSMIPYSSVTESDVISWLREFKTTRNTGSKDNPNNEMFPMFELDAESEFIAYKERISLVSGTPW